jgi:DNA-3-methyladenine glycosylase
MNTSSLPPYRWLEADSLTVAPQLLGWKLISQVDGAETAGIIVEVEAYHGLEDPASHAYRGLTPRTAPMFEAGGTIYVYLSYGLHSCLNIVTGPKGEAQAVLLRALQPSHGLEVMATRRRTDDPKRLTRGPGSLGQALGISRDLSGTRIGEKLSLRPPTEAVDPTTIAASPRIGITKAADHPWRFYLKHNPFVSGPKL